MEEKINKLHAAIQNGANLIYRDGAFWPGPLDVWDSPPHNQLFHIRVPNPQESEDEPVSST